MSGIYEGDVCGRKMNCQGIIQTHPVENCHCHINPPCSECTQPRNFCPVCGWEECDDIIINDFVVNVNPQTGVYRWWEERKLNRDKIDWISRSHTHFSMIKEGCFPKGTKWEEVEKQVKGTFGGRLEKWDEEKCEFKYIAYTD